MSYEVTSLTPVRPRAVTTAALALSRDCPRSISAATRVVSGLITVLPLGAARTPAKALLVSVSVPPLASRPWLACSAVSVTLALPSLPVVPTMGSFVSITPSSSRST